MDAMGRLGCFSLALLGLFSCARVEPPIVGAAQTLCDWTAESPGINGKTVRFTAMYLTDLRHGAFFIDRTCNFPQSFEVWDSKLSDGSYDRFRDEVWADFRARRSFDYKVDVSGTLRVAPPSGAIMDPLRDKARLAIEVERVWGFERGS